MKNSFARVTKTHASCVCNCSIGRGRRDSTANGRNRARESNLLLLVSVYYHLSRCAFYSLELFSSWVPNHSSRTTALSMIRALTLGASVHIRHEERPPTTFTPTITSIGWQSRPMCWLGSAHATALRQTSAHGHREAQASRTDESDDGGPIGMNPSPRTTVQWCRNPDLYALFTMDMGASITVRHSCQSIPISSRGGSMQGVKQHTDALVSRRQPCNDAGIGEVSRGQRLAIHSRRSTSLGGEEEIVSGVVVALWNLCERSGFCHGGHSQPPSPFSLPRNLNVCPLLPWLFRGF